MRHSGSGRRKSMLDTSAIHRREAIGRHKKTGLAVYVVALAAFVLAAIVAGQQIATAAEVRFEAEDMELSGPGVLVNSDISASGDADVAFYSAGSASTHFSGELTGVNLRARELDCTSPARLRVYVDGLSKGTVAIPSSTYGDYALSISDVGVGSHRLQLEYTSDRVTNKCDRAAYLDYLTLTIKDAVEEPPTTTPEEPPTTTPEEPPTTTPEEPPTTIPEEPPTTIPEEPPTTTPEPATGNPFTGERFYVNPNSRARATADQWYATGRTADAKQMEKIAGNGDIFYFSEWTQNAPGGTSAHVDRQTDRIEAAGALPVYGVYAVPNRDCGAYSSGGFATGDQYRAWINDVVTGLQGRKAVVVVEPDGLSSTYCLSSAQLQERFELIHYAVNQFESHGSYAYIDASNCFAPDNFMANRLNAAGIADATGFARNVSNFCWTPNEIVHGKIISAAVGGKPFIIDTSRNGLGPYLDANYWCNPPGRALGPQPTANTDDPLVHAYYWLKRPGESDGTCDGYPTAGTWVPDYALGLAQRAAY